MSLPGPRSDSLIGGSRLDERGHHLGRDRVGQESQPPALGHLEMDQRLHQEVLVEQPGLRWAPCGHRAGLVLLSQLPQVW